MNFQARSLLLACADIPRLWISAAVTGGLLPRPHGGRRDAEMLVHGGDRIESRIGVAEDACQVRSVQFEGDLAVSHEFAFGFDGLIGWRQFILHQVLQPLESGDSTI